MSNPSSDDRAGHGNTWATLVAASCNLLNLAAPGRLFYANQDVYTPDEYARKIAWTGAQIERLNADIAGFQEARVVALFHAGDVQTAPALRRELAYSHVHQGWPEVLDQVWVSEEFVASSTFAIGDVLRVEYSRDHLSEGRDRVRSDHGFARAVLRVRLPG